MMKNRGGILLTDSCRCFVRVDNGLKELARFVRVESPIRCLPALHGGEVNRPNGCELSIVQHQHLAAATPAVKGTHSPILTGEMRAQRAKLLRPRAAKLRWEGALATEHESEATVYENGSASCAPQA